MFQTSNPQFPSDLDGLISPCIARIPTGDENRSAVYEMNPLKAPGPDGMPGLFFRHYWGFMGSQLVEAVQSFFREGWMLKELYQTYITLIPKVQGACNFAQVRPISLCNFSYKVITKILVARLRPLLHKLIDLAQVAFIPNRNITENVVLAQEVVHCFKHTN